MTTTEKPIDRLRAEMKKLEGTWHISRSDPSIRAPKTSWLEEWTCVVLYAILMGSCCLGGWVYEKLGFRKQR